METNIAFLLLICSILGQVSPISLARWRNRNSTNPDPKLPTTSTMTKVETPKTKTTVVVTGFGVFNDLTSNPSWEAVKLMKTNRPDLELVKIKIPVIYNVTDQEVDRIWSQYKPELVVHCGVSHLASCLTFEMRAVQKVERYILQHCYGNITPCKLTTEVETEHLHTKIDLNKVVMDINSFYEDGRSPIAACMNNRAGRFLCEYIYRCSLQKNKRRTVFIHVPDDGREFTHEEIAIGLEVAVEILLKVGQDVADICE